MPRAPFVLLAIAACTAPPLTPTPKPGLHVEGNRFVDGKTVRLLGVSHSGTEYDPITVVGSSGGRIAASSSLILGRPR